MQYHKSLKEIVSATSKLTFETIHIMSKAFENNPCAVDVKIHKYCNRMGLEVFKTTFQKLTIGVYDKLSKKNDVDETLAVIISLSTLKGSLFNGNKYIGVEVEEPAKSLEENEAFENGALDYNSVIDMKDSKEDFYKIIYDEIENLVNLLSVLLLPCSDDIRKLEWNAKPAQLAYLLNELNNKGWLRAPLTNGEVSSQKMANLCDKIFSFNGTKRSLSNSLNKEYSLSDTKQAKFAIPDLKDIE